jgi:hypothetical protein
MSAVYRTNVYSNICKLFVEFIMYGTEGAHEKKEVNFVCWQIHLAQDGLCYSLQADHPKLNFKDKYSESYRDVHPTAPVVVPWMSGVISA